MQHKAIRGLDLFPQNLCWTQALQQTESALWWASQLEKSQRLSGSRPAGRPLLGPSSQAGQGTCRDWGYKREVVEEGSHVVAGGGSFHTLVGAGRPHTVVDYHS